MAMLPRTWVCIYVRLMRRSTEYRCCALDLTLCSSPLARFGGTSASSAPALSASSVPALPASSVPALSTTARFRRPPYRAFGVLRTRASGVLRARAFNDPRFRTRAFGVLRASGVLRARASGVLRTRAPWFQRCRCPPRPPRSSSSGIRTLVRPGEICEIRSMVLSLCMPNWFRSRPCSPR